MSRVPLKHLVDVNQRSLAEDTDPDQLIHYIDIGSVGTGLLVDDPKAMPFGEAPSRARRLVREGDTIVSTVRTYLRAVWPVRERAEQLVVSTGFAVLTPRPELDPRYLGWMAQSDPFVDAIVARSVGVSYPAINPTEIGELRVDLPSLGAQRAIADYLDTETTRIDALVTKKQSLLAKLEERARVRADKLLLGGGSSESLPPGWTWVPTRRLCPQITVGVVVDPSSYFVDDGVPFIHGTDIRRGWINESDFKHLSSESNALLRKSQVRAGDVLAMRVGEPGRSSVVPPYLDGANCASVLIFRRSDALESEILSAFLNGKVGRSQIEAVQYGAAQGVLNVSDALDLLVPVPPREAQSNIVRELRRNEDGRARARRLLDAQVALLREHRQALITAAVTGELEIAGVE